MALELEHVFLAQQCRRKFLMNQVS